MKLVVAGTGYVGLVAGVCFAEKGHDVTCVDVDENKVKQMESGVSPIYEDGLEELMKKNNAAGKLHYTTDYKSAYKDPDAIFIGVGTPEQFCQFELYRDRLPPDCGKCRKELSCGGKIHSSGRNERSC